MEALKVKMKSILVPYHFFAYGLTFLSYGCIITGLGPLIPYLSALTGYTETQYSYLFFWRSIGFLTGAFVLRFVEQRLTFHNILLYSSLIFLPLAVAFCFVLDLTYQGIIIFFLSLLCCCIQVTVNLCVLETQKNGDLQFWMLACHGFFGIGGLIGPIFVYFFEVYSFIVMGLLAFLVTPCYYILKTPQNHQKVEEEVSKQAILEELKNTGHQGSYVAVEHKPQRKLLMSFMFLLYLALQCTFGSWIASYAVLQKIATKQEATRYSSIFWVSITLFRFVSSCFTFKPMKKLSILSYSLVICSFLTILLIMIGEKSMACLFSAITFGMCNSSMFPLLFSIPTEYNLDITASQGASFMIWAAMGEGVLSTLTGYMMAWFTNDMMFYSMFAIGFTFLVSTIWLKKLYEKQTFQSIVEIQMKMIAQLIF